MDATEIKQKADALSEKITHLVHDFIKESGITSVEFSSQHFDPKDTLSGSQEFHSVKIRAKI